MKTFIIEGTLQTPTIKFDPDKGVLEIKGSSIIENAIDFYKPLMDYLEKYMKAPKPETIVNIQFDFFNTDSSKCILGLLKKLEGLNKLALKVLINWHYKNEDMLETAENYEIIVHLPFKMIRIAK